MENQPKPVLINKFCSFTNTVVIVIYSQMKYDIMISWQPQIAKPSMLHRKQTYLPSTHSQVAATAFRYVHIHICIVFNELF